MYVYVYVFKCAALRLEFNVFIANIEFNVLMFLLQTLCHKMGLRLSDHGRLFPKHPKMRARK